jgi:hypothetical protein
MSDLQERKDLYVASLEGIRPDLKLVPPFSSEFSVYGGQETTDRARAWATDWHYLLARGVPACAHGLYLMPCPGRSCVDIGEWADHGNLWVPDLPVARDNVQEWAHEQLRDKPGDEPQPSGLFRGFQRPFLLFAPYADEISDECRAYAKAHGLFVSSQPWTGDDWYGHGSLPIRLSIMDGYPMWPIEREVAVALTAWPIRWDWEEV